MASLRFTSGSITLALIGQTGAACAMNAYTTQMRTASLLAVNAFSGPIPFPWMFDLV